MSREELIRRDGRQTDRGPPRLAIVRHAGLECLGVPGLEAK
jgi:hypothetical protein